MARVRGQARLARRDPLTELGNRRAFDERFDQPRTGDVVLGIGDLDGFKEINDVHRHLAGDACLREVAAVLAAHARRDDAVFRWGGDEFAVLLPAPRPRSPTRSSPGSRPPSRARWPTPPARRSRSRSAGPRGGPTRRCAR